MQAGATPARAIERYGWVARRLLSESHEPVKRIAQRRGFGSAAQNGSMKPTVAVRLKLGITTTRIFKDDFDFRERVEANAAELYRGKLDTEARQR